MHAVLLRNLRDRLVPGQRLHLGFGWVGKHIVIMGVILVA